MAERRVMIGTDAGLHARPAALFVRTAARSPLAVTVAKDGTAAVDAKSILSVLGLDARRGDEIVIAADGEGAEAVLDELAAVVSGDGG